MGSWLRRDREVSRKPSGAKEPVMSPERAYMPHCDQSILHAPGECRYCDDYPDWQEIRNRQRINFTNHSDPDKAPCPSEFFRPGDIRDLWGGNVARPPDDAA